MRTTTLAILTVIASLGASTGCDQEFVVTPMYNHANGRIVIDLTRELEGGEVLYTRARRGNFGVLDCSKLAQEIAPVDDPSGERIDGPTVDNALTRPFYDGPEWFDPTPEMLQQITLGTDSIIDVCVLNGTNVVVQIERDLFQAWDKARGKGIGGKADDPSGEQRITSPLAYAERCVGELGEIPFFKKTGEGEYETYNCLDSTPIPMTVTGADGSVNAPQQGTEPKCDNPQYIYSLCEAGPRVTSAINDQGTRWVLLCRKSVAESGSGGSYTSSKFNDIAMIGSNPFTGKTCFFQNALYQKTDGANVPHPGDTAKSQNLWSGVHGGMGSGIQCGECHSMDAFVHSPWIDGAKDTNGRPVVPKIGVDPDLAIGANDMPYAIVNRRGNGWTMPKQIVSPQANACLKCHRMGISDKWSEDWNDRINGTDATWVGITTDHGNKPENKYWMPPDHTFATAEEWNASEAKAALEFIQACGKNPSGPGCASAEVPENFGTSETGGKLRNPVNLADDELARKATEILGFNKNTPSQVCAECHAPNELTVRDWQEKTTTAEAGCFKDWDATGEVIDETSPGVRLDNDEFKVLGPFDVAAGSFFEISIAGTGDIDLYIKRGAEPSLTSYDCRPFTQSSSEKCDRTSYNAAGPAQFYIGLNGTQDGTVKISAKYTKPNPNAMAASARISCFRLDSERSDSPFNPGKLGIYSAGAHLGWFQDVFKAGYPEGENGNTADTWAYEYGRFKNRVSMPKGNHPRFAQAEFDIVAEWFARGLPRLTSYIAPDTGPTSCTPSVKPEMSTHVNAMSTQGWGAINRQAGMNMYGCSGTGDPRSCLTSVPNATTKPYGQGWSISGTLRVLKELSFKTFFWMRSSADGRFVANGATGAGSIINDLQTDKDITVDAAYDPGFFPDNHGWMFQGTPIGAAFCSMSLLRANPAEVKFNEPSCSSVSTVSLYQHLGAGLGGADYFAVNSQFTSDNPHAGVTRDPSAAFANTAEMKFTPMMFDGTHYVGKADIKVKSPYEGDSVLSPSTQLVISRFGNQQEHLGYVVRKVNAVPNGASYSITTQEVGRYCMSGAKPSISFDEKFFVTHSYVKSTDWQELGFSSANDATFQEMLQKGTSNVYVTNMLTGVKTRVTNMKPGQYALFPHFRSDGWFYFLVRDTNSTKEYAVASDAALSL